MITTLEENWVRPPLGVKSPFLPKTIISWKVQIAPTVYSDKWWLTKPTISNNSKIYRSWRINVKLEINHFCCGFMYLVPRKMRRINMIPNILMIHDIMFRFATSYVSLNLYKYIYYLWIREHWNISQPNLYFCYVSLV